MDPLINMKHELKNYLGTVFKRVQVGTDNCLSIAAVLENYGVGMEMV